MGSVVAAREDGARDRRNEGDNVENLQYSIMHTNSVMEQVTRGMTIFSQMQARAVDNGMWPLA